MTDFIQLDVEYVRACFKYFPSTGRLVWRTRPEEHFVSLNACAVWNSKHADKVAGSPNSRGYLSTKIQGTLYQNHRLAWVLSYGVWPSDQIDHINGDPSDNRITNLRTVSNTANQRNRKRNQNNSSGVNGVYFHSRDKIWGAFIREAGRVRHLGSFPTFEDAAEARRLAEQRLGYSPRHGRVMVG